MPESSNLTVSLFILTDKKHPGGEGVRRHSWDRSSEMLDIGPDLSAQ